MATDKQIASNRRNAVQHGFTADHFVASHEEQPEFTRFRDEFLAEHHPETATEMFLVEQMVTAAWRLRRLRIAEAAYWDLKMIKWCEDVEEKYDDPRPRDKFAYAMDREFGHDSTISNLSRYEARIERSFYKALHELQRLRAARGTDAICPETKRSEVKRTDPSVPVAPPAPADRPRTSATPIREIGFVSQTAAPPAKTGALGDYHMKTRASARTVSKDLWQIDETS